MNIHDATEQAYKNGYDAGVKEFSKRLREKAFVEDGFGFYIVVYDQIIRIEDEMTAEKKGS